MMIVTKEQKKYSQFLSGALIFESWIIGTTVGLVFLGVAGWLVFWQTHQNRILPAVAIEGVSVGGLNSEDALTKIQKELPQLQGKVVFSYIENNVHSDLEARSLINAEEATVLGITIEEESISEPELKQEIISTPLPEQMLAINFADFGVTYDYKTAIQTALLVGREESLFEQIRTLSKLAFVQHDIKAPISYDTDQIEIALSELENQIFITPKYPRATLAESGEEETVSIEVGSYGRELDFTQVHEKLLKQLQYKQSTEISLNEAIIQTGRILSEEEKTQALEFALAFVGKSIVFELPDTVRNPSQQIFELSDTQLIPLLSFPTGFDTEQIQTILQSWNEEISVPVVEPELEIETTQSGSKKVKTFTPPQNGLEIDVDQATSQILEVLEENKGQTEEPIIIQLPFTVTSPTKNLGSLNELGIQESIGLGVSHYVGSIPNRAFNVSLSAQKINNLLIAPGEEFSFNREIGTISRETGFRSAYVIKDGRTVLGDGGGVCQVSTTVFRAALDAGLEITRRLQHSYRVGYYEQHTKPGLDATVYSGNVDFRFKNDTDHYILMHNKVDAQNAILTTEFFGTSDGRSTEIISHEVWDSRPAPAPQYFSDPSLKPGQVVQVDWAVGGIKTRVKNEIRDKNGEVLRVDEYYSSYVPWSAKYLVGE